ncbi:hypothetical protein ACSVC9_07105 [Clostridium sp. LBM24168]
MDRMPCNSIYYKYKFNKTIALGTAYNITHHLNYSKTRPKKTDKRVNKELLEDFRASLDDLLEAKTEDTVILYEDEAIITSDPTTTAICYCKLYSLMTTSHYPYM